MNRQELDRYVRMVFGCGVAAGPRALLGLDAESIDPEMVETAAEARRRRIDELDVEDDVKVELARLLDAAARVLSESEAARASSASRDSPVAPVRTTPVHPRPLRTARRVSASQLTPFDRQVLAILVAGGGWNGRTRVLISGLAQQLGVNATTLRKVVIGLAGFMRHEGGVGTLEELSRVREDRPTAGPASIESVAATSEVGGPFDRARIGLRVGSVLTLFVLLAVFFGVVLLQVLTAPSPVVRRQEARRLEVEAAMARADLEGREARSDEYVVRESIRKGRALPRRFDRVPDLGASPSEPAILAASRLRTAAEPIAGLARRLRVRPERLSDEDAALWRETVASIADCWPLLPEIERQDVVAGLTSVFEAATDATVRRRLFRGADAIVARGSLEPLDVWRRSFHRGWMAALAADGRLPAEVRGRARDVVASIVAAPPSVDVDADRSVFHRAAVAELDAIAPDMVDAIGREGPAFDAEIWERWFDAQRELRADRDHQAAMLAVVRTLLERNRELATDGRSLDLLGRLVLREVDWSSNGPDPAALADAYAAWFRAETIDDEAIWVLASLLAGPAGIGWYQPEFVPDPALGRTERRRRLSLALGAWPQTDRLQLDGERRAVDAAHLSSLESAESEIRATLDAAETPLERLQALLAAENAAMVAASLAEGRAFEAGQAIEAMERAMTLEFDDGVPRRRGGSRDRAIDGAWATEFEAQRRNQSERLRLVRSLESDRYEDLGPRDSATLALAVWADPDDGVRQAARDAVLRRFSDDPEVALALLDTIGRAARGEDVTRFVEAFTETALPSRRDPGYVEQRRLAMARVAARLNRDAGFNRQAIESLTDEIVDVVDRRAAMRGLTSSSSSGAAGAAQAATAAAEATRAMASNLFLAIETSRTIEEIDRRWRARTALAEDDLQRTIAAHLAELEFLVFAVQAELPSRSREIGDLAAKLEEEIFGSRDPIAQAALAALAISEIERGRLVPATTERETAR